MCQAKKGGFWGLLLTALLAMVFLAALVAAAAIMWAKSLWGNIEYEQIMTNLTRPAADFDIFTFSPVIKYYIAGVVALFLLGLSVLKNKALFYVALVLAGFFVWQIKLLDYYYYKNTTGDLYEKHYVKPEVTAADFPATKRNLLILYVESLENYVADPKVMGKNLFEQTDAWAKKMAAPQFKNYHLLYGTNYTKSALVAGHCGVPDRGVAGAARARGHLQNIVCLSDILAKQGYETWFGKTGLHSFANTDIFYQLHQYKNIIDYNLLSQNMTEQELEANKSSFGGLADELFLGYVGDLFDTQTVKEPFLMTLFTVDTHWPDTVLPKGCEKVYGDLRDNVMCSDKNVFNFLQKFKQTKYWDNTTVVVLGDHPMYATLKTLEGALVEHKIYNAFFNLPHEMTYDADKPFTAVDLAPTFLESIGVKLKNHALGLGRSLFSDEKSLIADKEVALNLAVRQHSKVYDTFNKFKMPERFVPYKLGTELDAKEMIKYGEVDGTILDKSFMGMVGLKLEELPQKDLVLELKFFAMITPKPVLKVFVGNNEVGRFKLDTGVGEKSIKAVIKKEFVTSTDLYLRFENNNYRALLSQSIAITGFKLY